MLRPLVVTAAVVVAWALGRSAWRRPVRDRLRAHRSHARSDLPDWLHAPLERLLRDAGVSLSPHDALWVGVTGLAVAALLSAAVDPVLTPVAIVGTVAAGPIGLLLARERAQRAFVAALPAFVELLASHLRSGHAIATALAEAAGRPGPLRADLARLQHRMELGATLDEALAGWADERPSESVRAVAGALVVASDTGGAAAGALDGLARSLRDALGAQAEAAALSAQARLSAVVVGAAPLAYLAFAAAADRSTATRLVSTAGGRVCLVLGLGLDALGALWMRRIVRSAP